MEGKKNIVHRLRIHHTATESGLVVSISYHPHFKQIAPSLHTPSLTTNTTTTASGENLWLLFHVVQFVKCW